jgi:hypothetical protein
LTTCPASGTTTRRASGSASASCRLGSSEPRSSAPDDEQRRRAQPRERRRQLVDARLRRDELPERRRERVRRVLEEPLLHEPSGGVEARVVAPHELRARRFEATALDRVREGEPHRREAGAVAASGERGEDERRHPIRVRQREAERDAGAHRQAADDGALGADLIEHAAHVGHERLGLIGLRMARRFARACPRASKRTTR